MGLLEGQVAIVTGASGGIGRAICRRLALEGADIVAHYHGDREGIEIAAHAVEAVGRRVEIVQADMAIAAEARLVVDKGIHAFSRLDVLVNNVGIFPRSYAIDLLEEEWDRVIDTNLKGAFVCAQAAARIMKQARGGHIVNVASLAIRGVICGAHYSASKAGLAGLTRTLALEWAPDVLVNCVAPGLVDTPMPRGGASEEEVMERARNLPLRRIGRPEDVASAVLFFASAESSWITGQTLHVNGGDYMV